MSIYLLGYLGDEGVGLEQQREGLADSTWNGLIR